MAADNTTIYYELENGRFVEWRNWKSGSHQRRIEGRYLKPDQIERLKLMRDQGYTDREIFVLFNPEIVERPRHSHPIDPNAVSIPLTMLSKDQLAWIIEQKLGQKLDSLANMNETDLITLFQQLNNYS